MGGADQCPLCLHCLKASFDKTVILWDVADKKRLGAPLGGHRAWVDSVAFRPDGQMLASADVDGVILFWDPVTRAQIGGELRMPQKGYTKVAFSPDGKTLAAVGDAGLFVLWDVASRELIAQPLKGPVGQFESLAFAPDGRMVATGDFNGRVLLWDVSIESWMAGSCNKANRNLSGEEWARISPNNHYERICPQQPVDISVVEQMLEMAKAAARGHQATALELYKETADRAIETDASTLNNKVCWFGILDGYARIVLPACDRAVSLAPEYAGWRDTRAIARSLTGDTTRAIEDLQLFVQSAQSNDDLSQYVPTRKHWLDELVAGRNPFDAKLLATFREEK
jgi:hypothetical protein